MSEPVQDEGTQPRAFVLDAEGGDRATAAVSAAISAPGDSAAHHSSTFVSSIQTKEAIKVIVEMMLKLGSILFQTRADAHLNIFNGTATACLRESGEIQSMNAPHRVVASQRNEVDVSRRNGSNSNRADESAASAAPRHPRPKRKTPPSPPRAEARAGTTHHGSTASVDAGRNTHRSAAIASSRSNKVADPIAEAGVEMLTTAIHALGRLVWADYDGVMDWTIFELDGERTLTSSEQTQEFHAPDGETDHSSALVRKLATVSVKAMDNRMIESAQCPASVKNFRPARIEPHTGLNIIFTRVFERTGIKLFGDRDFYGMLTAKNKPSLALATESYDYHDQTKIVCRVLRQLSEPELRHPLQRQHSAILHDGNMSDIMAAIEASEQSGASFTKVTLVEHALASRGEVCHWPAEEGLPSSTTTLIALDCESANDEILEDLWNRCHVKYNIIFVVNVTLLGIRNPSSILPRMLVANDIGLVPALTVAEGTDRGSNNGETVGGLMGKLLTKGTTSLARELPLKNTCVMTYDTREHTGANLVANFSDDFVVPYCLNNRAVGNDVNRTPNNGQFKDGEVQLDCFGNTLQFDTFYAFSTDVFMCCDNERNEYCSDVTMKAGQVVLIPVLTPGESFDVREWNIDLSVCATKNPSSSMKEQARVYVYAGHTASDKVMVLPMKRSPDNELFYPLVAVQSVPPSAFQVLSMTGLAATGRRTGEMVIKFDHELGGNGVEASTAESFALVASGLFAPQNIGITAHCAGDPRNLTAPVAVCALAVMQEQMRRVRHIVVSEVMPLLAKYYEYDTSMKYAFPELFCIRLDTALLKKLDGLHRLLCAGLQRARPTKRTEYTRVAKKLETLEVDLTKLRKCFGADGRGIDQ